MTFNLTYLKETLVRLIHVLGFIKLKDGGRFKMKMEGFNW